MSDQFTEQLSPYLDGELDDLRRARLEAHLAGCAECAAVLADLRAIVAAAPEYPGREPARDLWPELEARLETERRKDGRTTEGRKDGKTEGDDVPTVRRSVFPSFRLSLPQLLAASIAMAALGSGSVWLALRGRSAPTGAQRIAVAPGVGRHGAGPPIRGCARPSFRPSVFASFRLPRGRGL